MMERLSEIYKPVRDILCDVLGIHPDEVIGSLSLAQVTPTEWGAIFIACEQAFSITLHDEIALDLCTAGDLLRAIEACLSDEPLVYKQPNDVERLAWYYE